MKKTREQYEDLINNSPLYEMDRDEFTFKSESEKLCRCLAEYYSLYVNPTFFSTGGGEAFMETFVACVKNYNKEMGPFISYFNRSLKINYTRKKVKEELDNIRCGISIPENKKRLINKIISYAKSINLDLTSYKNRKTLADNFKIKIEDIDECLLAARIITISNIQYNSNGEEYDLYDIVEEENVKQDEEDAKDELHIKLKYAEVIFNELKDDKKEIVSLLFTRECVALFEKEYGIEYSHKFFSQYSFYNNYIYDHFIKEGKIPTQKKLAEYLGKSEQVISKTLSEFEKKIRKK